jgi:hypothetical protein
MAQIERLLAERNELLAALKEIAGSADRGALNAVIPIALAVIRKATGSDDE